MALDLAPFGRWTLRDKTEQRRSALRYAPKRCRHQSPPKDAKGSHRHCYSPLFKGRNAHEHRGQADDALVVSARIHGVASRRSAPKQIECWPTLDRVAEQSLDLSYGAIVGILRARSSQGRRGERVQLRMNSDQ